MRRVALMYGLVYTMAMVAGCGKQVETSYGRLRTQSVNGTEVLAGLFRSRGDQVRGAVRLIDGAAPIRREQIPPSEVGPGCRPNNPPHFPQEREGGEALKARGFP